MATTPSQPLRKGSTSQHGNRPAQCNISTRLMPVKTRIRLWAVKSAPASADIAATNAYRRFVPRTGLMNCNKICRYSITLLAAASSIVGIQRRNTAGLKSVSVAAIVSQV